MIMEINVPDYTGKGFKFEWEYDHAILTRIYCDHNIISIQANAAGLVSLARILLTLAQSTIPDDYHIHLDEFNSLEEGSCELILAKVKKP